MNDLNATDRAPATEQSLEKDGLMWLLIGAAGFFFGFSWVTGPLGWYFARRLKAEGEDARVRVPDVVRAAHIIGIVTTVITYIALVIVVAVVGLVFAGVIGHAAMH